MKALTADQLAARWGITAEQVRALIRSGKLTAMDVGTGAKRCWRIPLREVLNYERGSEPPTRKKRRDPDMIRCLDGKTRHRSTVTMGEIAELRQRGML